MSKRNTEQVATEQVATENTENTEDVATLATADLLIGQGFASGDADLVVTGLNTAFIVEQANTVRGVKATLAFRVTVGNGLVMLARLDREAKQGGKDVTAAEAEKAATKHGFTAGQVSRSFAGLCIRTVKVFAGQVETLVAIASGLFDTDEGPISMGATDLLLWAEKRAGIAVKASNAGDPQPRDMGEKRAADEKRKGNTEKAEKIAAGRREELATLIAETPRHKVAGLVMYETLAKASTENLETLRTAISDLIDTRNLAAKAEKDTAAKVAAAVKAETEAEILALRAQAKAEAEAIIAAAKAKAAAIA